MWNDSLSTIKSKLSKQENEAFDNIVLFDSVQLANSGLEDDDGFQIFTPRFIVKDMVESVGKRDILDFNKTVLEPTSGDGAFTVYILLERLKSVYKKDKGNFEINSLKSLSTIYSIEMDKTLIVKQRNNIFTALHSFINDNKINVSNEYFDLAKCIISTNFIWGMFNSDHPISMLLTEVVYKMPEAEKGKLKTLQFPVWDINNKSIDFHMEDAEIDA
ncbi:MAG: hypothetical protein MJ206_02225 [Bacilli bacterium]|nr:hypothetical protein [Bacilli bacterium]